MSESAAAGRVRLDLLFRTFLVLGATSFGGGGVASLREALVTERGWLDDEEFLGALEPSQTLPGLNATNMSVIVGDRLRGLPGARRRRRGQGRGRARISETRAKARALRVPSGSPRGGIGPASSAARRTRQAPGSSSTS